MCLQNSINEFNSYNRLESLDHDTFMKSNYLRDECDYIEIDDCKDIPSGVHDLTILELNVRGLVSKQHDLSVLLRNCTQMGRVDVVLLVETWVTADSEGRIWLPGYTYYGKKRLHKKGGGVGILVRDGLRFKPRLDLEFECKILENCFIELTSYKRSFIIGSLYRPPNSCDKNFLDTFENMCKRLNQEKNREFIIGLDHNLDFLKHNCHKRTQLFLELLCDYNHLPCITRPTRITNTSATLIDNIFVIA